MMTKRDRQGGGGLEGADEPTLPGLEADGRFRIPPGPVERAVARSVRTAVEDGRLDPDEHAGAVRTASSVARIVDRLTPSQTQGVTPYQAAQAVLAARELAAQLDALGLTPSTKGDVDPLDALLDAGAGLTTT